MKKITTIKFTLLAVIACLFLTASAQAATYTVNSTADTGDGTCDASCTLRDAIAAANGTADDDVIEFDAIVFSTSQTITLISGELTIANNGTLTINGTGADQLSVSGNSASRVFLIPLGANATINAITITGGNGLGAIIPGSGGGIFTIGTTTLNNSTVSNNSAASSGGGINNNGGTTMLNNSTVSNNSATDGGGIFNTSGTTMLNNSIIANSTGGGNDCSGTVTASYSLIEDGTCGVMNGVNNNLTGDPMLGPLQNNGGPTETHALLTGSIAIDKGNSTLTTDQRGLPRPVDSPDIANAPGGNGADIGSFEVQAVTAASVSISGRVLSGKRGVASAIVHITDQNGNIRTARTSSFGYYRFNDVSVGETYIISIISKRYLFAPQVVFVGDEIINLDFTALAVRKKLAVLPKF